MATETPKCDFRDCELPAAHVASVYVYGLRDKPEFLTRVLVCSEHAKLPGVLVIGDLVMTVQPEGARKGKCNEQSGLSGA
jgi:hypothetical protein